MKRFLALFLVCALSLVTIAGCGSETKKEKDANDYIIEWADPSLEYAVRQHLGKESGSIYVSELERIQLITIKDKLVQFNNGDYYLLNDVGPMTTLEDLPHFNHLGSVALSDTSLSDLSPLAEIDRLQQIMLYGNKQISDISVITDMNYLVVFIARNNAITDFSPILEVDSLKELELKRNRVTVLDFTGRLPRLQTLTIDIRDMAQLDSLGSLANLTELDLSGNRLTSVEVLGEQLAGLEHISKLHLGSNQIEDLSPLAGLTNLTLLDVSRNNLTSLSGTEGMTKLITLNISRNEVSDISVLKGMKSLKKFEAANNQISDATALADLRNLTDVDLSGNQLTNPAVFEKMKWLKTLNLSGNPLINSEVEQLKLALKNCKIAFDG